MHYVGRKLLHPCNAFDFVEGGLASNKRMCRPDRNVNPHITKNCSKDYNDDAFINEKRVYSIATFLKLLTSFHENSSLTTYKTCCIIVFYNCLWKQKKKERIVLQKTSCVAFTLLSTWTLLHEDVKLTPDFCHHLIQSTSF